MSNSSSQNIDTMFRSRLPDNFYYNHYELSQIYPDFSPEEWRQHLKLNERFIMNEVSAITEASARQSLQRLGEGQLTSQDIAAIKQLLERSEQINSSSKDARTFVMMQFNPENPLKLVTKQQKQAEVMRKHNQNVHDFYNLSDPNAIMHFDYRERNKVFIRNQLGTLHFPDTTHRLFESSDLIYLRLFNPNNAEQNELPDFEDDEDLEEIQ